MKLIRISMCLHSCNSIHIVYCITLLCYCCPSSINNIHFIWFLSFKRVYGCRTFSHVMYLREYRSRYGREQNKTEKMNWKQEKLSQLWSMLQCYTLYVQITHPWINLFLNIQFYLFTLVDIMRFVSMCAIFFLSCHFNFS